MRSLAALAAVAAVFVLPACFGGGEPLSTTGPTSALSSANNPRAAAIADMATRSSYASSQAFAAAAAGRSHDLTAARAAAIELAQAAAEIQAKAAEVAADGGADGTGVAQEDIDNAVTVSALAAQAAGEIGDALDPPSQQSCTQVCGCEGCSQQCTDQPGNVDDNTLTQAIDDASSAGTGCQDAGDVLAGAGQEPFVG